MPERCEGCELDYHREPGFYLGSIYVNYGLTAILSMVWFFYAMNQGFAERWQLGGALAICLFFPLLIFRHARAIWLAFDQYWDPQENTAADRDQS
jgi:hypothetical protein